MHQESAIGRLNADDHAYRIPYPRCSLARARGQKSGAGPVLPAESSTETVARALAALPPSDLLRLKRVAQLRAQLIPGLEWDELLNEALLRALDGSRRWPEGVPLLAFIAGIMRSLDGRAQERRRLVERALAVGQTPAAPAADARLHARQCLAAIVQIFCRRSGRAGLDRRAGAATSGVRRQPRAAARQEAPRGGAQAPRPRHLPRPT